MIIGIVKEIMNNENRVSMTPIGVRTLTNLEKCTVLVEKSAGEGSGFSDEQYLNAGAQIVDCAKDVWNKSDFIIKVKAPLESEYKYFRKGLKIMTYFHLAANENLTKELLKNKVDTIAYETLQDKNGNLPLLAPMSEIAGKMSVQIGANLLEKNRGGSGILLGGAIGVAPAKVTIIGGGNVGFNAAKIAVGMGADVTVLDTSCDKLSFLDNIFSTKLRKIMSTDYNIEKYVTQSDLVIGAVLIPSAKAPTLVKEEHVKKMKKGSVLIDIAIDQGGIIETMDRTTDIDNPTYKKYGITHYAVSNIPGVVPKTSTIALTNATLPYIKSIADLGFTKAIKNNETLASGINTYQGNLVNSAVGEALDINYTELSMLIGF